MHISAFFTHPGLFERSPIFFALQPPLGNFASKKVCKIPYGESNNRLVNPSHQTIINFLYTDMRAKEKFLRTCGVSVYTFVRFSRPLTHFGSAEN